MSNNSIQRPVKLRFPADDFGRYALGENFMPDRILGMIYGNTRK